MEPAPRNLEGGPGRAKAFLSEASAVIDGGVVHPNTELMGPIENRKLSRRCRRFRASEATEVRPPQRGTFSEFCHV
jgi:hypothetical protein